MLSDALPLAVALAFIIPFPISPIVPADAPPSAVVRCPYSNYSICNYVVLVPSYTPPLAVVRCLILFIPFEIYPNGF